MTPPRFPYPSSVLRSNHYHEFDVCVSHIYIFSHGYESIKNIVTLFFMFFINVIVYILITQYLHYTFTDKETEVLRDSISCGSKAIVIKLGQVF